MWLLPDYNAHYPIHHYGHIHIYKYTLNINTLYMCILLYIYIYIYIYIYNLGTTCSPDHFTIMALWKLVHFGNTHARFITHTKIVTNNPNFSVDDSEKMQIIAINRARNNQKLNLVTMNIYIYIYLEPCPTICRRIVWVCLNILCGWRLKG